MPPLEEVPTTDNVGTGCTWMFVVHNHKSKVSIIVLIHDEIKVLTPLVVI